MLHDLSLLEERYLDKSDTPKVALNTRSKLLEAAVALFSKHGYNGASLRQISNLAGVKHGSIQYHYESKLALWKAAINFLYGLMVDVTRQATDSVDVGVDNKDLRAHMIEMSRLYIRFSAKHPELFRILSYEFLQQSERLDWIVENFSKPLAAQSMERIEVAKAAGVYSDEIPNMNLYYLMMTASRTIFLMAPVVKMTFGVDVFESKYLKDHEDAVIKMIYG